MGVIRSILVFTALTITFLGYSQGKANYQTEFLKAKEFFRTERWGLAQDAFEKLTSKSEDNPFSAYASFYYGLCAFHQGHYAIARDMMLQIGIEYPKWNNSTELFYWLSLIYFNLEEYELALQYAAELEHSRIESDVVSLQKSFIYKLNSYDSVKYLYSKFPDSYVVGDHLAFLITKQNFLDQDLDLLEELNLKFELGLDSKGLAGISEPKEKYEISLLFPFLSSELEPSPTPKVNQFVLDIYQGMVLAADSLNRAGSTLNFTLFDTKRDTSIIKDLLKDNRIKQSDLIVGPLYFSELIQDFSIENQINVVHPFAKNHKLIDDNPYYFLYSTLPTDVGNKAASYVLGDTSLRRGIVFYGDTERDSLMATSFVDSVKSGGFEVLIAKKIPKGEEREALKLLASGAVVNKLDVEELVLPPDSIDIIFVAATGGGGGSVYSNVLAGTEARGDSIEVLGSHNWIDDNVVDKSTFQRLPITVMAYDLINYQDSTYIKFQDKYVNRYGLLPSKFAAIGYEMLMFFGSSMQKYGKYFQLQFKEQGFIPGSLSSGFDYSFSNSNTIIPIIRWDGEKTIHIIPKPIPQVPEKEN